MSALLSALPRTRLPYSHIQKVAWSDLDAFAHVNHTKYAVYFENARTEFFNQEHAWDDPGRQDTGPVVYELQIQFLGQVRYPATLDITIGLLSIGSRKFQMACTMWKEDVCVCRALGDFLWIHFEKGQPMRLPQNLVDVLERFAIED